MLTTNQQTSLGDAHAASKPMSRPAEEVPEYPQASYYGARYYDSNSGRFLSEDPVGYAGGDNFYSYVDNAPEDFADPFGLCPKNPRKPCGAKLPSNSRRRTMVQTLMGEMSGQNMVGQDQFADDESGPIKEVGLPGGPEITNDTLDAEDGKRKDKSGVEVT
jgi:RHS repeat-associated protein